MEQERSLCRACEQPWFICGAGRTLRALKGRAVVPALPFHRAVLVNPSQQAGGLLLLACQHLEQCRYVSKHSLGWAGR